MTLARTLACLLAVQCGPRPDVGAPQPAEPSATSSAGSSASSGAGARETQTPSHVELVPTPMRIAVDGDLAEWAPASAVVRVAVSREAVHVAATLPASGALWLGLAVPVPPLPEIGPAGAGGETLDLNCEVEPLTVDGPAPRRSAKSQAECLAAQRRHAELEAAHARRFRSIVELTADGAMVQSGSAPPSLLGSARVIVKGRTLEASLPLSALPRLTETPLRTLQVFAGDAQPSEDAGSWAALALPSPVAFGVHAEVASIFESLDEAHRPGSLTRELRPAMSYHPTAPDEREVHRYARCKGSRSPSCARMELVSRSAPVVRWIAEQGPWRVARVSAYSEGYAFYRDGVLMRVMLDVDDAPISPEETQTGIRRYLGSALRGEVLQLISFAPPRPDDASGLPTAPCFAVVSLQPDGRVASRALCGGGHWRSAEPSHEASFDILSFRGDALGLGFGPDRNGVEERFAWNGTLGSYLSVAPR